MQDNSVHEYFMLQALLLAEQAEQLDEVPVGAVIVFNEEIIGGGFNQPITTSDPTSHAEIVAIRQAAKHLLNYRMPGATIYVTLEPCTMCVGAMIHARIKTIVYGAAEPRAGAIESAFQLLDSDSYNHQIDVVPNILATKSSALLRDFFRQKRAKTKKKLSVSSTPDIL